MYSTGYTINNVHYIHTDIRTIGQWPEWEGLTPFVIYTRTIKYTLYIYIYIYMNPFYIYAFIHYN